MKENSIEEDIKMIEILDNAGIYQLGFKDGKESYIKKSKRQDRRIK